MVRAQRAMADPGLGTACAKYSPCMVEVTELQGRLGDTSPFSVLQGQSHRGPAANSRRPRPVDGCRLEVGLMPGPGRVVLSSMTMGSDLEENVHLVLAWLRLRRRGGTGTVAGRAGGADRRQAWAALGPARALLARRAPLRLLPQRRAWGVCRGGAHRTPLWSRRAEDGRLGGLRAALVPMWCAGGREAGRAAAEHPAR